MRQLVDWKAAIWAGLGSAIVFIAMILFVTPIMLGGNIWVMVRLFASVLMGETILAPPATFNLSALLTMILTTYAVSTGFALLIAYIIHRGGLITGIIGGGFLGWAIYGINFYTFTYFFPWFFAFRGWEMILNHIIFGAVAGGIYEWLEVEKFVPVDDE